MYFFPFAQYNREITSTAGDFFFFFFFEAKSTAED